LQELNREKRLIRFSLSFCLLPNAITNDASLLLPGMTALPSLLKKRALILVGDFLQACQRPDNDGDSWNASASTTMTILSPVKSFEGSSETGEIHPAESNNSLNQSVSDIQALPSPRSFVSFDEAPFGGLTICFLSCPQTTPPVDTFTSLVHPDWERAGLKKVRTSIPHYFPRMPEDKIEALKMFSLEKLQLEATGHLDSRGTQEDIDHTKNDSNRAELPMGHGEPVAQTSGAAYHRFVGKPQAGAFSGTEDLQPGMLAAIYTYDEVSCPWFGEVQAIEDGDTVKIHWYMGGYPKSWKPMSGTNSTSSVHRESLLLWGFTLTEKSQRLTRETAAELKWLYQETDGRMNIQQDRISEEV
ncbi:unnamed protein product, partial [Darwinula stevensoni]